MYSLLASTSLPPRSRSRDSRTRPQSTRSGTQARRALRALETRVIERGPSSLSLNSSPLQPCFCRLNGTSPTPKLLHRQHLIARVSDWSTRSAHRGTTSIPLLAASRTSLVIASNRLVPPPAQRHVVEIKAGAGTDRPLRGARSEGGGRSEIPRGVGAPESHRQVFEQPQLRSR